MHSLMVGKQINSAFWSPQPQSLLPQNANRDLVLRSFSLVDPDAHIVDILNRVRQNTNAVGRSTNCFFAFKAKSQMQIAIFLFGLPASPMISVSVH